MTQTEYLEFPARFSTRLPGGKVHMVRLTKEGMSIFTYAGLYGNKESICLLEILYSKIVDAAFENPIIAFTDAKCGLRYINDDGKEVKLKFHVVDQGLLDGNPLAQERQNKYTESIAHTLVALKSGDGDLPALQSLPFAAPSSNRNLAFVFGIVVGAVMLIGSFLVRDMLFNMVGTLVTFTSLGAIAIDLVRLRTSWHPAVKSIAYLLLFMIVLVLFVLSIFLFEIVRST